MKIKSPSAGAVMFLLFTVLFFALAFLSGCATNTITKVDKMAYCDEGLGPTLLIDACSPATPLANGSVFQDALRDNKDKNSSLELCRAKVVKLQQALAACRAAVTNHNNVIDTLNKK
jgi:hypothetical protein